MFCFPNESLGEFAPSSFHKSCAKCTGLRRDLDEQFPRVLSQDLHWENRTKKLKRSFARQVVSNVAECKTALGHQNVTVIWWPWINSTNFNNTRKSRPGSRFTDDSVIALHNNTLVLNLHPSLDCL